MGLVGCTVWMASCQETLPQQQAMGSASYETMRIVISERLWYALKSRNIPCPERLPCLAGIKAFDIFRKRGTVDEITCLLREFGQ